ncbi:DUF7504 family protein [Natrononativus amylolyticus]|uniref:DUF7504 family protein n=1 Tax=Natrononativus amylolyticus TaxID=2963434 RepID=UPI0020CE2A32|nr:hypothetical protein [Natrononativus amylolyticus]
MTSTTYSPPDPAAFDLEDQPIPPTLSPGATVLVAMPADSDCRELPFALLARDAATAGAAIAVTTGQESTARLESPCGDEFDRLGVVETTAGERLTALYRETPTIRTPVPGDIERTTVALSELHDAFVASSGPVSLSIASISPILEESAEAPATVLASFLEAGRSTTGIATIGVEYTRHDEATMRALSALASEIVWVERRADGRLSLEYQPSRTR